MPAAHSVQDAEPAPENEKAGQLEQVLAADAEYMPAAQLAQLPAPVLGFAVPAAQDVQAAAAAAEYLPAEHDRQLAMVVAAPAAACTVPAGQAEQVEAPVQMVVAVHEQTTLLLHGM